MKRLILVVILAASAFSAYGQLNEVCYNDTSLMVEEINRRNESSWSVKEQYQHGDWNVYYDFALTKLKAEYHYTDKGVKTGIWKEYFKSGKLRSEWDYNTPLVKHFPPGKEFYESGSVKVERSQTADTLIETEYFPGGQKSIFRKWDKNAAQVVEKRWCENGQLVLDYNPTAAEPLPVKRFHCNGKLQSEYNWWMFGYTGVYKEYHDNGKVSVSGQYTEKPANVTVFMARKTGDWVYYDDKGKVIKTEKWERGRLITSPK